MWWKFLRFWMLRYYAGKTKMLCSKLSPSLCTCFTSPTPYLNILIGYNKNKWGYDGWVQSVLANIPENIANSFVKGFGRRMLEYHKHSWNNLKQEQVTLNGSGDLTIVLGKETWNKFRHCLWVTNIQLPWCGKPCQLCPNSPFWLRGYGWEQRRILGNEHAKVTLSHKCTGSEPQALILRAYISFLTCHMWAPSTLLAFSMKAHAAGLRGRSANVGGAEYCDCAWKHLKPNFPN